MLKQNTLKWENLHYKEIDAVKIYLKKLDEQIVTLQTDGRLKFTHGTKTSSNGALGQNEMSFFHNHTITVFFLSVLCGLVV